MIYFAMREAFPAVCLALGVLLYSQGQQNFRKWSEPAIFIFAALNNSAARVNFIEKLLGQYAKKKLIVKF